MSSEFISLFMFASMMLLQCISTFFKDVAAARGKPIA